MMDRLIRFHWNPPDGVTRVGDYQDHEVKPGEIVTFYFWQAEAMKIAWSAAMVEIPDLVETGGREPDPEPFLSPHSFDFTDYHHKTLVKLARQVDKSVRTKEVAIRVLGSLPSAELQELLGESS